MKVFSDQPSTVCSFPAYYIELFGRYRENYYSPIQTPDTCLVRSEMHKILMAHGLPVSRNSCRQSVSRSWASAPCPYLELIGIAEVHVAVARRTILCPRTPNAS